MDENKPTPVQRLDQFLKDNNLRIIVNGINLGISKDDTLKFNGVSIDVVEIQPKIEEKVEEEAK